MNRLKLLTLLLLFTTLTLSAEVLSSLSIKGVPAGQEGSILSSLPLVVGKEYTPLQITKAIKLLYKSGRFQTVSIDENGDNGLVITVEMNDYCDNVEFEGVKELAEKKLLDSTTIERGILLSDQLLFENEQRIKELYRKDGFIKATVKAEVIKSSVPGYAIVKYVVDEGKEIRVEEIRISGNKAFTDRTIRRKLKTKQRHVFNSGEFDEDLFPKHLDTLIEVYKNKGYLDANIASDSVKFNSDSSGLIIDLVIDEGVQYKTGDFFFENNEVFSDERLGHAVAMDKDKPFSQKEFMVTQQEVGNVYRNDGYLRASIEPKYKYRGDTIDVVFTIVEGEPSMVGLVRIEGNDKTREQVIRREIRIYPGDVYSQAKIMRSLRDITQLKYFETVLPDIVPREDGSNIVDLIFRVVEKENIGQFSAGLTYSGADKNAEGEEKNKGQFGGNFSISIPNFRGAGEHLDASFEISKGRKKFSAGFVEPWIFNRQIMFSSRAFMESVEYDYENTDYDYTRRGVEFGLGKRLKWPDDYWSASVRYMLSYDKSNRTRYDLEDELDINIVRYGLLSRLYLSLTRDDTDRPQFPERGSVFRIANYFGGFPGLIGNVQSDYPQEENGREPYNYNKTTISYDWYMPLFWKFTLGTKSKFGMITTLNGEKPSLGYGDLFQVGGVYYDGIVRGYEEGELGTDLCMVTLSSELRFPIVDQRFYAGVFADFGNSFNQVKDIRFDELHAGVGFGFRLLLPMVGLLGFDFSKGLDDPDKLVDQAEDQLRKGLKVNFIMNRDF